MIPGTLEMRFTTATTCAILSSICLVSAPASARGNLRAEAVVGWDNVSNSGSAFAVNLSDFTKVNGLTYGGGIGYDLAVMPMISIGADAEINGSSGRREAGPAYLRADRDIYAGGRVSVKVLPSTKIYAKLGYANADFTNNASFALHGPAIFYRETKRQRHSRGRRHSTNDLWAGLCVGRISLYQLQLGFCPQSGRDRRRGPFLIHGGQSAPALCPPS
jgi:hypothetical protein